jgi:hypothetical protein
MNRAILFSQYNQEWSYALEKAELLMNTPPDLLNADINVLLEFYTIKEHFNNNRFLAKWSYWQKAYYVKLVDIAFIVTRRFFLNLEPGALSRSLEELDCKHIESFWKLFDYFQLHGKINRFVLCRLMDKYPAHMRYIVQINQQN